MSKSQHQQRIEKFMLLAKQSVPNKPTVPNAKTRILRAKLIMEECIELISKGLGIDVTANSDEPLQDCGVNFRIATREPDIVELADGCADVSVVTIGTLSSFGISDNELFEEVDNNNIAKFENTKSYWRDDGKFVKASDHPRPRVKEILDEQTKQSI